MNFDGSVSLRSIAHYRRILLVFPHPDDETFSAGGLAVEAKRYGASVTSILFTKGERGTPDAHIDEELKKTRTEEAKHAASLLGVSTHIHLDYGDGELPKRKKDMTAYIVSMIKKQNPDLIVTFDLSGLYGHPDHIACSESVRNAIEESKTPADFWQTTLSKKLLSMIELPEHMADDPKFLHRRRMPEWKVAIPFGIIPKIRAIYGYESQFPSFVKSLPFRPLPPWFLYSVGPFEYFSDGRRDA
jgi:LmbE family N-acetylglucosaminyl deacetylase